MEDELFKRTHDGLTLLCIKGLEQMQVMAEVHEGIYGAHQKHIVHRFVLPQTITVNQGTVFNGDEVMEFAKEYGIQMLNSSPYYAQNSTRDSIQASPYELVYGHAIILQLEVTVKSSRAAKHYGIPIDEYVEAMFMELQDVECKRIDAFDCMMAQKKKVERVYNKNVKLKLFGEGDLVWKTILPLGTKDLEFGK
ncbi:uncharacterized protein LOC114256085 [Camellia sinensis]|uniref:uncharacterized protein LOC114256085 n=1 Tax=Camellia sinensis TaxID=4442 RepID=UPI001035D361|nr:uncharacterized protein LOC114256085 [Camellia sinensis]